MEKISSFLYSIHYNFAHNLSYGEAVCLFALAVLVWLLRKRVPWAAVAYSVFLILYITLIRRTPGATGILLMQPRSWVNQAELAAMMLNALLYFPLGVTVVRFLREAVLLRNVSQQRRNRYGKWLSWGLSIIGSLALSVACEVIQYYTGRGWADINDVIANVFGMVLGMIFGNIRVRRDRK